AMAHPLRHAESSARKFGGKAEDYLAIHRWFDQSKACFPDFRHRAFLHHAAGIFLAETAFGVGTLNSAGKVVPVRYLGEQHVREDLGRIPTLQDWLVNLKPAPWMYGQKLDLDSEANRASSCLSEAGSETDGRADSNGGKRL
ncbi:MAG: DUF6915 family protein, partial [Terriglobia bacterium]